MKHHDNKTQPLGKQSVPDVSCGLSYKHEPWATAFKYLTQHGCTQRLAELIEGKSHIPREARKLLAQYLRGEVTVKSPDHKNRKLTAAERDEIQARLWFLSDNCSRLLTLSSEISDKLGCEPSEVFAYVHRLKRSGIEALEKQFQVSRKTVTDFVSSRESKMWLEAIAGKKDYKIQNRQIKKEELHYDSRAATLERELEEAFVTLRFPHVYLNPLSPEALHPGAFDPDYQDRPVSVPFYPGGPETPAIEGRTLEELVRSGGWWNFPNLDPKPSESEIECSLLMTGIWPKQVQTVTSGGQTSVGAKVRRLDTCTDTKNGK